MTQDTIKKNKKFTSKKIILFTLLLMLILVAAWHVLLPLLDISIAITASVWGIAIATIVLICIATLLFFVFTGIGVLILGGFVFVWTILAIILFPLLFPALIPILLLMLVVAIISKKKKSE